MTRWHEALTASPGRRPEGGLSSARPDRIKDCARWLALVGLAIALSGCAYSRETLRLPGNAGTIAIGTIRNRTLQGEVDVRLAHRLRSLFLKHPGIEIRPMDHSDLVLDIELTLLRVIRARDLASTNLTSVAFQLAGQVSIFDRRTSQYFVYKQVVQSLSRLDFDSPTTETPAIRDEGLEDAIQSFAVQVENLMFLTF